MDYFICRLFSKFLCFERYKKSLKLHGDVALAGNEKYQLLRRSRSWLTTITSSTASASSIHTHPHTATAICVCGWCFTFSFKSINDSHVGKSISWNIKWLHIPFQFVHQSPWRWRKSIRFSVIYKFFRCLCSNSNLHPVKIQEAIWQETKTQLFPLER